MRYLSLIVPVIGLVWIGFRFRASMQRRSDALGRKAAAAQELRQPTDGRQARDDI